jgi:hypothetical protein
MDLRIKNLKEEDINFIETLCYQGLERYHKFYSIYDAIVVDNKDPDGLGRIQIRSPGASHSPKAYPLEWVGPAAPMAGNGSGHFFVPNIGDIVYVMFSHGDPSLPIAYLGSYYIQGSVPIQFQYSGGTTPTKQGVVTQSGHSLVFDNTQGSESVTLGWNNHTDPGQLDGKSQASLVLDNGGDVTVMAADGSNVHIDHAGQSITVTDSNKNVVLLDNTGITITDANGNKIFLGGGDNNITLTGTFNVKSNSSVLDSGTVSLGSSPNEVAILGKAFLQAFNSHVHPHPMGPTSAPLPPVPSTVLSQTIKISP